MIGVDQLLALFVCGIDAVTAQLDNGIFDAACQKELCCRTCRSSITDVDACEQLRFDGIRRNVGQLRIEFLRKSLRRNRGRIQKDRDSALRGICDGPLDAVHRNLKLQHDHLQHRQGLQRGQDLIAVHSAVGTGADHNAVFRGRIQRDQRDACLFRPADADTLGIDAHALQRGFHFASVMVIADLADHLHRCTGPRGSTGLIGTFAAGGNGQRAAEDRFPGGWSAGKLGGIVHI